MSDLEGRKESLTMPELLQVCSKGWPFFRKSYYAKITSEKFRVFMHSIAHIKASNYACKADKILRIFIAPIVFSSEQLVLQNHPCLENLSCALHAPSTKQTLDCADESQSDDVRVD